MSFTLPIKGFATSRTRPHMNCIDGWQYHTTVTASAIALAIIRHPRRGFILGGSHLHIQPSYVDIVSEDSIAQALLSRFIVSLITLFPDAMYIRGAHFLGQRQRL